MRKLCLVKALKISAGPLQNPHETLQCSGTAPVMVWIYARDLPEISSQMHLRNSHFRRRLHLYRKDFILSIISRNFAARSDASAWRQLASRIQTTD